MSAITFDTQTKSFLLTLRSSFYALRLREDGALLHTGSGPVPAGATSAALAGLEKYEEPNYVWENQGIRYELPSFGDLTWHDVALKVAFPQPSGPVLESETFSGPIRDVRPRYESHEIRTGEAPGLSPQHGLGTHVSTPRETLCIRLKDIEYDFWVTLFYRVTPEHDVIERWVEVENGTPWTVDVENLAFGTVHLPEAQYEVTRAAGTWAREFVAVKQNLEQGKLVLDQQGLNTGHSHNPFYLVNERGRAFEDAGNVYFGALAFSGNWSLRFEVLPTRATRIHGGYETTDFELKLAPGEKHRTPAFVHGSCAEGWGGASRRLHAFTRDYILPGYRDDEYRPVLYNSWEATYFDLSLEGQSELARRAAAIGVELYCVDDGWFGGRRNDRAGLGDWTVSPDIFPGGLQPLIDVVQGAGMKFGLWVEPEMVNPDSDLYRAHPEWVLHFPGRPRTESRQQLILDFGRLEVVEHIYGVLDALLQEYDIEFFKWDMNRYATEPGSVAGKAIWRKHVEGLYSIMDRLRKEHPKLSIQSCSGGGGRIDLGILGRTDQVWTSDNTDAYDRVQIEDGFSLAYPARAMESWVTHEHNHQTGRSASLDLRFDVAMRGALGIGTPLTRVSVEELEVYKRKIAFYKKIRPAVQEGDLYRLSPEPYVSIWQFVTADGSLSAYSIAVVQHLQGIYRTPAKLKGLIASASYRVVDEHENELGRYSGFQLMTLGVPGDTVFGGITKAIRSRTVLIERVD